MHESRPHDAHDRRPPHVVQERGRAAGGRGQKSFRALKSSTSSSMDAAQRCSSSASCSTWRGITPRAHGAWTLQEGRGRRQRDLHRLRRTRDPPDFCARPCALARSDAVVAPAEPSATSTSFEAGATEWQQEPTRGAETSWAWGSEKRLNHQLWRTPPRYERSLEVPGSNPGAPIPRRSRTSSTPPDGNPLTVALADSLLGARISEDTVKRDREVMEGWDKNDPKARAYARETSTATCPACGHAVELEPPTANGKSLPCDSPLSGVGSRG
jgi:hypothetical protein